MFPSFFADPLELARLSSLRIFMLLRPIKRSMDLWKWYSVQELRALKFRFSKTDHLSRWSQYACKIILWRSTSHLISTTVSGPARVLRFKIKVKIFQKSNWPSVYIQHGSFKQRYNTSLPETCKLSICDQFWWGNPHPYIYHHIDDFFSRTFWTKTCFHSPEIFYWVIQWMLEKIAAYSR